MKNKNRLIKISLISVILMVVIANLNFSYGNPLIALAGVAGATGLVAVLSTVLQVGAMAIASAVNGLIAVASGIAEGDSMITGVSDIVFNRSSITTASFFKNINNGYTINMFAEKIGDTYYIIRNLAIGILLFVLLYIGIRMAISTVAEQEAKYKKMLQNWAVSLALVFLLHYIILLTFVVNDTIVNVLYDVAKVGDVARIPMTDVANLLTGGVVPIAGWPEVIVYVMLTVATVAFLITYIKRVITLGFLIVISPLITITYSIDKIGDGKSQALNTWLQEFIYSVLIQPFHCIIYIVFVKTSLTMFDGVGDGTVNAILAVASMLFMLKAEGIIKKIFGLRADSMGDTMKMGTMAIGFATGFFKNINGSGKGKVPEMKGNVPNTKTAKTGQGSGNTTQNSSSANNSATQSASNGANSSNNGSGTTGENQQSSSNTQNSQQSAVIAQQSANSNVANNAKQNKIQKALSEIQQTHPKEYLRAITAPTGKFFQRYSGEKGLKGVGKGALKFGLKNGAAAFGAIAGAGLSDGSAAVSTAMAFKGAADSIDGIAGQHKQEEQAEKNQEVFAGAYEDYANEFRRRNGEDSSNEEIMLAYEALMEKDKKEIKEQWELDAYNNGRQIIETGEALGYKDGTVYLTDTIRKVQNGEKKPNDEYVPKFYDKE